MKNDTGVQNNEKILLLEQLKNNSFLVSMETVNSLIENGIDLNEKDDKKGYTPFGYICNNLNVTKEILELCIEKGKADLNQKSKSGITPFCYICYSSGVTKDILEFCIEKGADFNIQNLYEETPFYYICDNQIIEKETLEFCIEKMSYIDNTILIMLLQKDKYAEAKILIESGKYNLGFTDKQGNNVFTYCQGNIEMLELLFKHGADYELYEAVLKAGDNSELLKTIAIGSQGAHYGESAIVKQVYPAIKDLVATKDASDIVKKAINLDNGEFKSAVISLIKNKYKDSKEIGQGDKFVKDITEILGEGVDLANIDDIKLSVEQKQKLGEYLIFCLNKSIKAMEDSGGITSGDTLVPTKDLLGKIMTKIGNPSSTDDHLIALAIELIDAGSMYASGAGSCLGGTVTKLLNVIIFDIMDDNDANGPKKSGSSFDFSGFVFDSYALTRLIAGNTSKYKFNEMPKWMQEQFVRSVVYKICKQGDYNDQGAFPEIFHYGVEKNIFNNNAEGAENISRFKQQLSYAQVNEIYKRLLRKDGCTSSFENLLKKIKTEFEESESISKLRVNNKHLKELEANNKAKFDFIKSLNTDTYDNLKNVLKNIDSSLFLEVLNKYKNNISDSGEDTILSYFLEAKYGDIDSFNKKINLKSKSNSLTEVNDFKNAAHIILSSMATNTVGKEEIIDTNVEYYNKIAGDDCNFVDSIFNW